MPRRKERNYTREEVLKAFDLPDRANEEIASAVREVTQQEPESGEELLGSEDLRRQLREAKAKETGSKS